MKKFFLYSRDADSFFNIIQVEILGEFKNPWYLHSESEFVISYDFQIELINGKWLFETFEDCIKYRNDLCDLKILEMTEQKLDNSVDWSS